jgi:hypothetical protein
VRLRVHTGPPLLESVQQSGLLQPSLTNLRPSFPFHQNTNAQPTRPAKTTGGMTFGESSLQAAAWGAAFGLPLVACSVAARTRAVQEAFPVLEELHAAQRGIVAPMLAGGWMERGVLTGHGYQKRHTLSNPPFQLTAPIAPTRPPGMSPGQLGAVMAFFVIPSLMFLLPGSKAGWDAATSLVGSSLLTPSALLGPALPSGAKAAMAAPRLPLQVSMLAPSMISAYTAGGCGHLVVSAACSAF